MSFYSKYELLEPVPDPGIRSFQAREITSGRKVVAHLMVRGYTSENNRILYRILHLPAESRQRIVEVGEYEGIPFVVTEDLGVPLTEWLSGQPAGVQSPVTTKAPPVEIIPAPPPPPPAVPAPEPEAPAPAMGEFTKMFGLQEIPSTPRASGPPSQPGEFTAIFELPASTPHDPPPPTPPVAPPPAPRVAQAPPKPAAPQPQGISDTPGEFTLIFDPPVPPPPSSPVSFEQKRAAAPERPSPPKPQPSEFPFVLPTPSAERSPVSSTSPPRDLEATGVFEKTARPVSPNPPSQGSGDFTRIISQHPAPQAPLRPPPSDPVPGAEEQNSSRARYVLILILIFLALLALGIILVFAVTRA